MTSKYLELKGSEAQNYFTDLSEKLSSMSLESLTSENQIQTYRVLNTLSEIFEACATAGIELVRINESTGMPSPESFEGDLRYLINNAKTQDSAVAEKMKKVEEGEALTDDEISTLKRKDLRISTEELASFLGQSVRIKDHEDKKYFYVKARLVEDESGKFTVNNFEKHIKDETSISGQYEHWAGKALDTIGVGGLGTVGAIGVATGYWGLIALPIIYLGIAEAFHWDKDMQLQPFHRKVWKKLKSKKRLNTKKLNKKAKKKGFENAFGEKGQQKLTISYLSPVINKDLEDSIMILEANGSYIVETNAPKYNYTLMQNKILLEALPRFYKFSLKNKYKIGEPYRVDEEEEDNAPKFDEKIVEELIKMSSSDANETDVRKELYELSGTEIDALTKLVSDDRNMVRPERAFVDKYGNLFPPLVLWGKEIWHHSDIEGGEKKYREVQNSFINYLLSNEEVPINDFRNVLFETGQLIFSGLSCSAHDTSFANTFPRIQDFHLSNLSGGCVFVSPQQLKLEEPERTWAKLSLDRTSGYRLDAFRFFENSVDFNTQGLSVISPKKQIGHLGNLIENVKEIDKLLEQKEQRSHQRIELIEKISNIRKTLRAKYGIHAEELGRKFIDEIKVARKKERIMIKEMNEELEKNEK